MAKIENKIHRFVTRNLQHIQEALVALVVVFIFGGILLGNSGLEDTKFGATLLGADTTNAPALTLPGSSAPKNVPKFGETHFEDIANEAAEEGNENKNDALLTDIFEKTLVAKIITVVKYVLGGVFMIYLGLYVINFLSSSDKEEASTKFKDRMIWSFVGFLIIALAEPFSQSIGNFVAGGELLTDPEALKTSAGLVGFSYRSAAHLIQYLLGGIALITIAISAWQIISATGDEETVRSARKTIVWAAIGLIIAGGSALFIDKIFAPDAAIGNEIIGGKDAVAQHKAILEAGQMQARILVLNYVKYFQTFIGAGAVLMLFLAGFKMVSAAGNEEIITKQRKMITWVFMGLAIILLSEMFVNVFMPETGGLDTAATSTFAKEMGGLANFFIAFSGGLAVLALIVGGLYVTTAVANPEQAEKGKKLLLAAAIGLIVTISAFALVNTVIKGNPLSSSGSSINVNIQ